MSTSRVLFIDAYDSFSNNIITLLKENLPVTVEVIRIDDKRFVFNDDAFFNFLDGFHAVVAGPGPGHPNNAADVGLIAKLWTLPENHILPVLGICLGLQSLALELGATVERLREPRHGMVTPVQHCGRDIFADAGDMFATQYHSLHVPPGDDIIKLGPESLWKTSKTSKELIPLAWDMSDSVNGPVLMGGRHCHKPFWGVQYHPESICTNAEGRKLVLNWWHEVCAWQSPRTMTNGVLKPHVELETNEVRAINGHSSNNIVEWRKLQLPDKIEVTDIVYMLRPHCAGREPILLESGLRKGRPVNPETGRFSIVGMHDPSSIQVRYSSDNHLEVFENGASSIQRECKISEVFHFIETFMKERKAMGGLKEVPFWGGLVGFISYEAGLQTIDVAPPKKKGERPEVWFVFVERSIVVDHTSGEVFVQSLRKRDECWLSSIEDELKQLHPRPANCFSAQSVKPKAASQVTTSPHPAEYQQKVRECQTHLRAGSSYELCLTDRTRLRTNSSAWSLYQRLRALNPAPFGSYINLSSPSFTRCQHDISIISSSPERFLSWSRSGKCQFRPIKGTVKKSTNTTRADAENILKSPKEQAENLMIVDLIRHDLSGVKGIKDVRVPQLMAIEEYETVYQLVSVIEGDIDERRSGVAALAASLPPGSMTGAPKKRSCELLEGIEGNKARGLYSGVIGYFDVGGGADFAVVIRTAFKWGDEDEWCVGAGGAITALSEPESEWEEMLTKRESVLRAFD